MLKRYAKIVQEVNRLDFSGLDDADLSKLAGNLSGDRLPQALAVIREVIDRRLGIWKVFDDGDQFQQIRDNGVLKDASDFVQQRRESVDDSEIYLDAPFYRAVREIRKPGDGLTFWPYDVQLMGALALYEGNIAEMGTGEGKTVVAVFPACLWALSGKKVHIATVNDYLALRDCEWMGPAFRFLGLSVDCILEFMTDAQRREAYKADIVYGNNYEFGFDYLRDNVKPKPEDRVQSKLEYVIVDEIDSIFMDEATTPLIVSGKPEEHVSGYWKFKPTVESLLEKQDELLESHFDELETEADPQIKSIKLIQIAKADPWNTQLLDYLSSDKEAVKRMRAVESKFAAARSEYKLEEDLFYVVDERFRTMKLTDRGMDLVEQELGKGFMTLNVDASHEAQRGEELRNLLQLLRAYVLHRKDEDYIVHNGSIIIVDEFTGRLAFGKKYEEGLHQAIECKEGLQITPENRVEGRITHPNYFRLYEKMVGMTATAHTEASEFKSLYKLKVVRIPTNRKVIRTDLPDRFYRTEEEKLKAIIDEIEHYHSFGRPVLVGTRSVEKSEYLSELLTERGIEHNVLNAKNHAEEAEIIKCAGQPYAVTIATNMAGRGTDIVLGADLYRIVIDKYLEHFRNISSSSNEEIQVNVYSQFEYNMLVNDRRFSALKISLHSPESGMHGIDFGLGLHVIGSERHGARRIDDQLGGRSGRQGDPGSSRFYLSLQDDLFRMFGQEETSAILKAFERSQSPKLRLLTRKAQQKSEETSYHVRRELIERDETADKQRKAIYRMRQEALTGEWTKERVRCLIEDHVTDILKSGRYADPDRPADEWNLDGLREYCMTNFGVRVNGIDAEKSVEEIKSALVGSFDDAYSGRERILGAVFASKLSKAAMIGTLEAAWSDYLSFQSEFDRSLWLRSYVKNTAIAEYRLESAKIFGDLLVSVRREALRDIFTYPLPGEKADSIHWTGSPKPISKQVKELLSVVR